MEITKASLPQSLLTGGIKIVRGTQYIKKDLQYNINGKLFWTLGGLCSVEWCRVSVLVLRFWGVSDTVCQQRC